MRFRAIVLINAASVALLIAACSGDDDGGDGGNGTTDAPTETDAPTATEPTDGDGGFTEDFGVPQLGSGGTGTIVLGGETLEYQVIVCSEEDGTSRMSGRGLDGSGEPFVAQVEVEFGFDASAEISRGASSIDDEGSPHWVADPPVTYDFGSGGRLLLTFDSTFTNGAGNQIDGSVDVNCGP